MVDPNWREKAKAGRKRAAEIRAKLPDISQWHRGQLIAALTKMGATKGHFSGELVEDDEFFARQSTNDLRTLVEDHWYLWVLGGQDIDTEPPDMPDVPEPDIKKPCRCACGYTCGRQCGLEIMECMDKHYVKDCEHDWSGPWEDFEDGLGGSVTCKHCGMTSMGHDLMVGP